MDNIEIRWSMWREVISISIFDKTLHHNGDISYGNFRDYDIETIGL